MLVGFEVSLLNNLIRKQSKKSSTLTGKFFYIFFRLALHEMARQEAEAKRTASFPSEPLNKRRHFSNTLGF